MARIIPSDLSQLALAGAHEPELETLAMLQRTLPDEYTIFHGVHWTRQYKGVTVFGEVDFVVLSNEGRVLCIEQKNGPLVERDGELVKPYEGAEKNVALQVHRALDNIREKFKFAVDSKQPFSLDYLIFCPDHAIKHLSAVGLDAERVVDSTRRDELATRIRAVLPNPASPRSDWGNRVYQFFRQTFEVVPDVHAHIDAQETSFTRLSGGLVEILDNIEMTPLKLRVLATAGNGKTTVARHFFDRAVAAGLRPLLICFNRPLAERLKHLTRQGGLVETWYGFLDHYLQDHGIKLDFDQMGRNPDFWKDALAKVEESALNGGVEERWTFDLMIVDEAQDFEEPWFQTLGLFERRDAGVLWLEDPNQNVRNVDRFSFEKRGFVTYRSLLNFRSPESIARVIRSALPDLRFTPANDLPGLGVGIHTYDEPDQQPKIVAKLIGDLSSRRFQLSDLVILSLRGLATTSFKDVQRVGKWSISRFTGEYDLFGNQLSSKGQVLFETVRRFKGQEAPAIILVDVAPNDERLVSELQALFCGMTRATVRLEIVCDANNRWVKENLLPLR